MQGLACIVCSGRAEPSATCTAMLCNARVGGCGPAKRWLASPLPRGAWDALTSVPERPLSQPETGVCACVRHAYPPWPLGLVPCARSDRGSLPMSRTMPTCLHTLCSVPSCAVHPLAPSPPSIRRVARYNGECKLKKKRQGRRKGEKKDSRPPPEPSSCAPRTGAP